MMYHPSKPRMMTMSELNAVHTGNSVAMRSDKTRIMPYPVTVGGYIGHKVDTSLTAQTVFDQRGSGFPAQVWGNFASFP